MSATGSCGVGHPPLGDLTLANEASGAKRVRRAFHRAADARLISATWPDLVYVASEASQPLEPAVSRQSIEAWVPGLADSDKTKLLVPLVANDDPHHLHAELIQPVTQAIEPAADPVPDRT